MKIQNNRLKNLLRNNTFIMLLVAIAVIVFFFFINKNYLSLANIQTVLLTISFDGLLTLGAALVLIGGNVDLSTGAVACFSGCLFGLACNAGIPWGIAFALGILVGLILGLINALLINELKFMSFISTLAVAQVYRGFVDYWLTGRNIQITNPGVRVLGTTIAGIPVAFLIFIIVLIVYAVILNTRRVGRSIYLIGGNAEAARLSGVNPKKMSYFIYINSAFVCALAGIIWTCRMHTIATTTGTGGETNALTAAVLGGVSFMGGVGGAGACFVGVFLLDFFNSGLTAVGFPAYWQIVAKGALLILALTIDFLVNRSKQKKLKG